MEEVRVDLKEKQIDIMVFLAGEYLEVENEHNLIPSYVPRRGVTAEDRTLLLAHKDIGISDIAQLKDKSLIIQQYSKATLGLEWLECRLLGGGFSRTSDFFKSTIDSPKASTAVLQVFFRQTDACLVTEYDFDVLAELNPQIAEQLSIVASSPLYAPSVVCVREDYGRHREDLVEGLAELHMEPSGQQLLMLFRVDSLVPFLPSYLAPAREIVSQLETLQGRMADVTR
jgi:phosphonate transport system substrate-binding protein